ncbi:MAG: ribonuclease [Deltaproteobacteria bacterium]|nr:ribonuclease [Deltaproteobacteria bacterium]
MRSAAPIVPLLLALGLGAPAAARSAPPCEQVVRELGARLPARLDEAELVGVLRSLDASRNRSLPPTFVTKREAQRAGWRPGRDLWRVPGLRGKSIGGDRFGNREGRLPGGRRRWREADLDYRGGHRGAKRLLFSDDGLRAVTVDHYRTFVDVPACR